MNTAIKTFNDLLDGLESKLDRLNDDYKMIHAEFFQVQQMIKAYLAKNSGPGYSTKSFIPTTPMDYKITDDYNRSLINNLRELLR